MAEHLIVQMTVRISESMLVQSVHDLSTNPFGRYHDIRTTGNQQDRPFDILNLHIRCRVMREL